MKAALAVPVFRIGFSRQRAAAILFLIAAMMFLLIGVGSAEETPDWAKRDYAASADEVYGAAMKVILWQHFQVKGIAGSTIGEFHIKKSPGYDMQITITRIDDNHSRVVMARVYPSDKDCSLNPVRKEVRKIIDGIDAELRGKSAGPK